MRGSPAGPRVLYVARPAWWPRALIVGLALIFLIPAAPALLWSLLDGEGPHWWSVTFVVGASSVVLGVAVLAQRPRFVVSTDGILVRGLVRTHRVTWPDVARVEVDQGTLMRGQTVVVTRSGTRVGSSITAASFALRRGESTYDHGPDLRHPAIPARAAIDAHQRYLHGEFGPVGQR